MIQFRPILLRLAAAAALLVVLLSASSAWAQAACRAPWGDGDTHATEMAINWGGRKTTVRACQVWYEDESLIVVEMQIDGGPLVRHQQRSNYGLEGEFMSLRFDQTRFLLSTRNDGLTLALRLASREQGLMVDDRFDYLWLYQFDGRRLQRVFDIAVDEYTGRRYCGNECGNSGLARRIVIVQPGPGHHGLHDLRVRQKSWLEQSGGKLVGGKPRWEDYLYFFDGDEYRLQR